MKKTRHPLTITIGAIVATLLTTLAVVTFMPPQEKIEQRIEREYNLRDPQFRRSMGVLLGPPITQGNRFEALLNGDGIFPPMLAAIRGAKKSITFETYIYWSGEIGAAFADALSERARAGVKVHVLLDWVGSQKVDEDFVAAMEKSGVQIKKFHKPSWYDITRLNNRTHRKLLVVDGTVGFTGGVGIAPAWTGNAQDPTHWRDSHFKAEGPVVAQMQAVFMDNWIKASGEVLHGETYFPAVPAVGESAGQMFSSSPAGGSESMRLMYLLAIGAASKTIDLSMAYFVPDDLARNALVAAAKRGVRVRIILPGPIIDTQTVDAASRATWGPLLEAGVQISQYQPTMYHCKVMVIDDLLVSVGSTNFDNRSFRLNDEANLNVYDEAFAKAQVAVFENDLTKSKPVTLAEWQDRPLREKLKERIAGLLAAQL